MEKSIQILKIQKKGNMIMEERNWKFELITVECPECKSTNVEPVLPFDYVKQCKDCGHQFSTGSHN